MGTPYLEDIHQMALTSRLTRNIDPGCTHDIRSRDPSRVYPKKSRMDKASAATSWMDSTCLRVKKRINGSKYFGSTSKQKQSITLLVKKTNHGKK